MSIFSILIIICCIILILSCFTVASLPIVLWHGMGDSCCNPLSMGVIISILKQNLPNDTYVLSLRIGDGLVADTEHGFFMNVNEQIEYACNIVKKDPKLAQGYNAIGFSQGAQFLRGLAQKCPTGMSKLISVGGQHQGIYGIPKCFGVKHTYCDYVRRLLNYGAYVSWIQNFLVQAEYWHNPLNDEEAYRAGSVFLADINNERDPINQKYRDNLIQLDALVMIKFENDTMVQPIASEWFEYYRPNQAVDILPLNQSRIYLEDRIGLRKLDEEGKLIFISLPGDHLQMDLDFFKQKEYTYLISILRIFVLMLKIMS